MDGKKILKNVILGGFLLRNCLFSVKMQASDGVTLGFWFNDLGQPAGDKADLIEKIRNEPNSKWFVIPDSKLYWAVQYGKISVLRDLFDEGVGNVNEVILGGNDDPTLIRKDSDSTTLLEKAASMGNVEIIKLLIENGADPNQIRSDCYGYLTSPVKRAVRWEKTNAVELLIENGADLFQKYDNGNTLLHEAIENNFASDRSLATVKLLLDQGLDPNAKNDDGRVPLVQLVIEIITRTGDYFSYFDSLDIEGPGSGCVEYAERTRRDINYQFKILELLAKRSADINIRDNNGNTPLHWAVMPRLQHLSRENLDKVLRMYKHLNLELFGKLIELGADVNIENNDGKTPLDLFARRKKLIGNEYDLESIVLLREHGAEAGSYQENSEDEFIDSLQREAEDGTQNEDEEKAEKSKVEDENEVEAEDCGN
ncbi:MAG: ankyrin repeat domain-containing protein [Puniceicoccales bacterium]|jgi:ankyrin repeat protein|nr:ankyrin repeat domain-containing protein [Puniceicoccales bacterium]